VQRRCCYASIRHASVQIWYSRFYKSPLPRA